VGGHVLFLVTFEFEGSLAGTFFADKRANNELMVYKNVRGKAIALTCLHRWVVRLLMDFASLPHYSFFSDTKGQIFLSFF
jgi:hypothetical protein